VIVEGRDMPEDTVRDLADGRIYTGNQALDNGLVDGLGNLDDTIDIMQEDLGLESPEVVRYQADLGGFGSLFVITIEQITDNSNELTELLSVLQQENSPRLMYLYEQ